MVEFISKTKKKTLSDYLQGAYPDWHNIQYSSTNVSVMGEVQQHYAHEVIVLEGYISDESFEDLKIVLEKYEKYTGDTVTLKYIEYEEVK